MIHYRVLVEPETLSVRGNAVCSGDREFDLEVEEEILSDLDAGHVEVWCMLRVEAWLDSEFSAGPRGVAYLGACSFPRGATRRDILECVEAHGMRAEALEDPKRECSVMRLLLASLDSTEYTVELS